MDKKISLQDIFDAAWQKFIVEDAPPATDGLGGCCYLTADGRKCAVGLCIPEGHPIHNNQNLTFAGVVDRYPDLWAEDVLALGAADQINFQGDLHDALVYKGNWSERFRTSKARANHYRCVAKEYGLTIPGER